MKQLVSILIPCCNAAPFVGAAIESALAQTWTAIEIIVVDDDSNDGSDQILKKYENQQVRVITPEQPLRSASKARNLAYHHATGDFIKFFDADDLLHPHMLENQVQRLSNAKGSIASSGWGRFYSDDLGTFKLNPQSVWRDMDARDWLVEAWMDARPMMQPGMFLIPRNLMDQVGGWDEGLSNCPCDDFEFYSRLFSHASRILYCDGIPLMYRSGIKGSLSKRKTDEAIAEVARSLMAGTSHLLEKRNDAKAKLSCANVLQNFIHSYYPRCPELLGSMKLQVAELGGSDLKPGGPPNFQRLKKIVGWKIARRVEQLLRKR